MQNYNKNNWSQPHQSGIWTIRGVGTVSEAAFIVQKRFVGHMLVSWPLTRVCHADSEPLNPCVLVLSWNRVQVSWSLYFFPRHVTSGFSVESCLNGPGARKKNMSTFFEAFIVLHSASRRGDSGLETVISMKKWNFESQESTFCLSHNFFSVLQEVSEGTLKFKNSYLAPLSKITTMIMVHPPENPSQHKNISGPRLWNRCSVGV